ncbi:plasmid pRiA4b ORF-3 family protein [Acidiphilium sp.]|uniref:plasmid pRiA4b ORF-3 family protein n=1 Tax=Acidiphilium sp. TaxID=527 RepID=UPI00258A6ED8|nr:plasmid pRiA4b ORF-3 family protein [Acidiphilium sp.]
MDALGDIIQVKIRLLGISPMIWRRVMVPTTMTLHELHGVLQVAMGWESIHLYAFDIYAVQYGSFELMMGSPRVPLAQFSFRKNDKFSYTYDMGDGWVHEIRIESVCAADPKKSYPLCTGGSGACPPEECGGPRGYLERRDEAEGYGAWQDFGVMAEWLDDLTKRDTTDLTVRDVLTDEVEAAMQRVVAREPYQAGKFSRKLVNQAFRDGRHRDLMHQQFG